MALIAFVLLTSGRVKNSPEIRDLAPTDFRADEQASTPAVRSTAEPIVNLSPPPPCDTQLPTDFREVTSAELGNQGFIEFGQILQPRSCPLRVANRDDQAFVWMADGGEIDMTSASLHLITAFGDFYRGSNAPLSDLGFYYQGEQFRLMISVQEESRILWFGEETSIRVTYDRRALELTRLNESGAYLNVQLDGEVTGARRVLMDSQGGLFFATNPLPGSMVTNWLTGEAIDTTGMIKAGRVAPGRRGAVRTDCLPETAVCKVQLDEVKPLMPSPLAGILRCIPVLSASRERLAYELETGHFRLRIVPFAGEGLDWQGGCQTRQVDAGDDLEVWQSTYIDAFAAGGSQISVVSSRDGQLYVGQVELRLRCPCAPRH